jgi:hypothetical protein
LEQGAEKANDPVNLRWQDASRRLTGTELVEVRMTVDAAIWARDADVSAPIPDEFKGLLDGRRSRVPFERHCAAESVPVMMKLMKFSLSYRRRGAGPYGLIVALPNIDPRYNIAPTMTIGGRDPA